MKKEKLIGIIVGFALTSGLLFYKANAFFTAPKIDIFSVPTVKLDGTSHQIERANDKFLIVNIWATWCAPCIKEMPYLASLRDRLDSDNWQLILISDEDIGKIESFKNKHKMDFDLLKAEKPLKDYGIKAYPTTYVIDKDKSIVFSRNGELQLFQTEFENALSSLDSNFKP